MQFLFPLELGAEEVTDTVDDRADDVVVDVRERGSLDSKRGERRIENQRASAEEDANEERAEQGATPTAVGIAADAAGTAREEADAGCRNHDGRAVEGNHEGHGHEAAKERADEADDDGVRRKREDCGAVDGRTGVGDELLGDAHEGRSDLGDELTHAVNQDGHASCELEASEERPDPPDVVAKVRGEGLAVGKGVTKVAGREAGDGHDVEEHDHEQGHGEDEVTEELEELGEVGLLDLVLLDLLLVLLGEDLAAVAGEGIADAVEVANCEVVGASELLDERLAERRKSSAAEAEDNAAADDGHGNGGAQGDEDQRKDAGKVQEVLTSQEDCLPRGDLGEYEVHDEAKDHDQGDLGTVGIKSKGGRNLDLRHNALHVEGGGEHGTKGRDLCRHGAGANVEDHETNDGLDGSGKRVDRRLLLQEQADEGDDAHDQRCVPHLHEECIQHMKSFP